LPRDVVAVEVRQVDIEKDDIGLERARHIDGGEGVYRKLHFVAIHLYQHGHRMHGI
jgi:hypothetical protein